MELKDIQPYLQGVTEVIASVVDIELCIINSDLEVIAGTGYFKNNVGFIYPKGCMSDEMIASTRDKVFFVKYTKDSKFCSQCNYFSSCDVLSFLMCPISYLGKRIGSLSLVALTDKQVGKLNDEHHTLLNFLSNLCNFIVTAINERKMEKKVSMLVTQYNTLINSLHEGIIAIDCYGGIVNINQSAKSILCLNVDMRNKNICTLFPEINVQTLLDKESDSDLYYEHELQYVVDDSKFISLLYNITLTYSKTQITGAVISFREKRDLEILANKILEDDGKHTFVAIKGSSKKLIDIKRRMEIVSRSDSSILIYGETGTGKNMFARAIHECSFRRGKPFIIVNCANIPASLVESELFGYDEGAFTGARKGGKRGKFELAHGGTLFFDEIGDMPLDLQSKLLQLLDTKKVERVGGIDSREIDVRIIAATNRDLDQMVKKGIFRSDLYYRICVIPFTIPPLRERRDDISLLIDYYLTIYCVQLNKSIMGFDNRARRILLDYCWPGNVRELKNAIEYAVNLETCDKINHSSLPPKILNHGEITNNTNSQYYLEHLERDAIIRALQSFGTNSQGKKKAATKLGISRATLYRKIKLYGIDDSVKED